MHGCAVAQRALCELLGRFGALRVITHVMTAATIGASWGGGYARYLESKTVEPERRGLLPFLQLRVICSSASWRHVFAAKSAFVGVGYFG